MPSDSDLPSAVRVERWARAWGAEGINVTKIWARDRDANIDFASPFPGHQPIRSSISLDDGEIYEATIRYGVLDDDVFPTHPSEDPEQVQRLRMCATRSPLPDTGTVLVNYGDTHRVPRPHLLLGWRPSVATDDEVVVDDDAGDRRYGIDPSLELFERFGAHVRREFRGEWAEDPRSQL
jgi:hypothetical protein